MVSCLRCATPDADQHVLEPLYACPEMAAVGEGSDPQALATLLQLRMEAIYRSRVAGLEYYTALLLQMYAPAYLHAEANPAITLSALYTDGMAPEQQEPVYAIESTMAFHGIFQQAISDRPSLAPSASVRFIRKALRARTTSIRYLNQHVAAMLKAAADRKLALSFLGHSFLGSLPHATSIAPPASVVHFFRAPEAGSERIARIVGSKGLYILLSEYISEVVHHYPDLFQLMARCSGRLPRPADAWIRAADNSVRPALFSAFESPKDVPASRRQLKNVPQLPVAEAVAGGNYATELQERNIKRKLSATVAAAVSPAALSDIYLAAIALVPRKPRVPRPLVARLSAKHGVDPEMVTTAVLHAIEQRGAFCAAKAPDVVARAQRAAVGGECYVKVCAYCSSIRDRIGKIKANKSTGEVIVHGTTASTVLDPPVPEDEVGVPVRRLGGEYQCANCRLYGGICEVLATGVYFQSFLRHVDRCPVTSTICCACGRLSAPHALDGQLPICQACHKKRGARKRQCVCAVCNARIHPTAARVTGICKPTFGFVRVPQTATLCIKCSRVADPSEPWDLEELRVLRMQSS